MREKRRNIKSEWGVGSWTVKVLKEQSLEEKFALRTYFGSKRDPSGPKEFSALCRVHRLFLASSSSVSWKGKACDVQ